MHQDEINELIKIAKQLDDKGYCKLSEKIDNINVKIALLSDTGAKAVIEPHPGKKYVRRQLGFPPQNVFESLQLKIEDLINKLKDKKNPNKRYTIDKFIDTILQGYLKSGYVNASFVDFLVKSPSFTEQVYRKIQNNTSLMLEIGYLYQNLSYKDNTPGRGWQIFQTESILKYHFRRIQIKTGLFF